MSKTKNVTEAFEAMGIISDVEKAKNKRQIRAGKGKKRGRVHKARKSILIVAAKNEMISRAARNIEGVDVVNVSGLNANVLAPGATPGRLTVWSEKAIKELAKPRNENVKEHSARKERVQEEVVAKVSAKKAVKA